MSQSKYHFGMLSHNSVILGAGTRRAAFQHGNNFGTKVVVNERLYRYIFPPFQTGVG